MPCVLLLLLSALPASDPAEPIDADQVAAEWRSFGYDQDTAWALWLMTVQNHDHARSLRECLPYWSYGHREWVERYIAEAEWYERIWDRFTWVIVSGRSLELRADDMRRLRGMIGDERYERGELPLPRVMFIDPSPPVTTERRWDWP